MTPIGSLMCKNMEDEFVVKLVQDLIGTKDHVVVNACSKLIRRHDKNLGKNGDYSFTTNKVTWQKRSGHDNLHLDEAVENMKNVAKVEKEPSIITLWLDRATVSKAVLFTVLTKGFNFQKKKPVQIKNYELARGNSGQLSIIRCNQVCQLLQKLVPICGRYDSGSTLIVGCSDEKHMVKQDSDVGIHVGHVVKGDTKKKDCQTSFLQVYNQFFSHFNSISLERSSSNSEQKRIENVHSATVAELQFQLLSNNTNQPVVLDVNNNKSSFVLYNYARIAQLFRAFKEKYGGEISQDVSQVDFGLLQEEEEWELVFNYLMQYESVVCSTLDNNDESNIKLGKLCAFYSCLANTFSRYYNRVHILRDYLPHLVPTMQARLFLIEAVRRTFEHGFGLLDIPVMNHM